MHWRDALACVGLGAPSSSTHPRVMSAAERILVSERGVAIIHAKRFRGANIRQQGKKTGLVTAIELDAVRGGAVRYVVEVDQKEVLVAPSDLRVTGEVDPDFELDEEGILDEKGSGKTRQYLCSWMATLMTSDESDVFGEGYTLSEVRGSELSGGYRVVRWEPTWERTTPNDEALAIWKARQATFAACEGGNTAAADVACEGGNTTPATRHGNSDAAAGATQPASPAVWASLIPQPSHAPAPAAPAAPAVPRVFLYGAVCTVWQPHLLLTLAIDVRSSAALCAFFSARDDCMRVLEQQPAWLYVCVNASEWGELFNGRSATGILDAHAGEPAKGARAFLHPSRRGTSKVAAFEGTAAFEGGAGAACEGGGTRDVASTHSIAFGVKVGAPSPSLAAQCRRPWAPALPFQVPAAAMLDGMEENLRVVMQPAPGSTPYLTGKSSARPNTPRLKVCVRLDGGSTGKTVLIARAAAAALQVCQNADKAQRGAPARPLGSPPRIVD